MKTTKEKMVLKIMVEPKEIPCHDCIKECMGDEFMRCKKLKAHNKKITAKEYDYDKAIEVMAKAICKDDNCLDSCAECILGFGSSAEEKEQFCQKEIIMSRDLSASYVSRAEAALNALLEGGK